MNQPPHNRELEPGEPLSRRSKPAPQSAKTPSPAAETPQQADRGPVNRQKSAVPRLPSMSWKESARSRSTPEEQARNRAAEEARQDGISPKRVASLLAGVVPAVTLAAVLWLPLPLGDHGNVNLPCHFLAEKTRALVNQRMNPLTLLLNQDMLTRFIRIMERDRNGARCAIDLLGWVFLDRVPMATFEKAERRRTR